jgi:hypothetical protein
MADKQPPLGIRLNNPGNLQWGDPWQGLVPRGMSMYANSGTEQQKRFCQFSTAVMGIRAIAVTLITYYDKYQIDTIAGAIARWAPGDENDTQAYVKAVAQAVDKEPEGHLNFQDHETLRGLVEAIIRHENGAGPLGTPNQWYTRNQVDEALRRAGVPPEKPRITATTVGTSATGAIGVAQLATVVPQVVDAVNSSSDKLSSGNVAQVIVGLVLIGLALFLAWSKLVEHREVHT